MPRRATEGEANADERDSDGEARMEKSSRAIWECAVRKSWGISAYEESGPASKNFLEFISTFARDCKTLVGAPPPPARGAMCVRLDMRRYAALAG